MVMERDGKGCFDCGRTPGHDKVCLEYDHDIPLWKVADLPDVARRQYFLPVNIRRRCQDCHKAKSAREAAQRANGASPRDTGDLFQGAAA